MRKVLALFAFCLLVPGLAQAKTLEELLVEKGVITSTEARASSDSGAHKAYWKGGTRLEFPEEGFDFKLNTQLQSRYEFISNEDAPNESSFRTRRARLQSSGHALNKEFEWRLQVDFVGSSTEHGRSPDLRDAYFKWHFCDWGNAQMGQFKALISRQENTSSSSLQFPDRTATSDFFALGRNQGAGLNMQSEDERWKLSAAVFNGQSDGEGRNRAGVDTNHLGVVAVRGDLWGQMNPFEEGDIGHTEGAAVNVGAAYSYSDAKNDVGAGLSDSSADTVSVDVNLKSEGFSLHGELFYSNLENDTIAEDAEPIGFYVQGGYFVTDKFEIAARAGYTDCDDGRTGGDCSGLQEFTEAGVSLNYFFWQHALKAQLAYNILQEDIYGVDGSAGEVDTDRVIFQFSAYL